MSAIQGYGASATEMLAQQKTQTGVQATAMNSSSGTASSSSSSSAADGSDITSSDFLTLLVTEMQNQDPTQPTDPNEYVQQMVGVNSLEQLMQINQDLGSGTSTTGTGSTGTGSTGTGSTGTGSTGTGTTGTGASGDATGATTAVTSASTALATKATSDAAQGFQL